METTDYQKLYKEKLCSMEDVLTSIKSGDVIFTTNTYSEPTGILSRIHEIAPRVENVRIWKGRTGIYPFMTDPAMKGHIEMYTYFYGPTFARESEPLGLVEMVPTDLQSYFTTAVSGHPPTVCMTSVTPMDENGNFHVPMNHAADGLAVLDCLERDTPMIVEVNPNMHHAHGSVEINIRDVDYIVEVDRPELVIPPLIPTEVETEIGRTVADLVNDGDTIQLGIGGIPNAVGQFLREKNDLGIHSEMFTPSMMDLIKNGNVTGMNKTYDKGLTVFSFAEGTKEMYPFIASREDCVMRSGYEVVDPFNIARHDHMVAINTLVEMDLTGQVCNESVGPRQISGSGGSFCFTYGAYRSRGGRSILAFPSRSKKGQPKIRSMLTHGAVVSIPRNYVDIIVTEYGVARLCGRTIQERARALIEIAHPDDRDKLREEARELGYV